MIDRSSWPPGPWDEEPDGLEWRSDHGFPCIAHRSKASGAWCGYVAVPPGHPWYGKSFWDLSGEVDVHGGLTYPSHSLDEQRDEGSQKASDAWLLGFDCAHFEDFAPILESHSWAPRDYERSGTYRTLEFVKAECEKLAKQAKDAAGQK